MASKRIDIEYRESVTGRGAANEVADDIDKVGKKAKGTGVEIDGLTKKKSALNTKLAQVSSSLNVFGSGLGTATSKTGTLGSSIAGLLGMGSLGGVAGICIAAAAALGVFAAASYSAAQTSQAEWAKFKGVVESAGLAFDEQKTKVKEYAFEAGVAISDVRSAQQKLVQTNNESPGALRAVHEMSLALGTNMEDAATAYTRIVSGSGQFKRTLVQLGIKPEDIIDQTTGKVNAEKLQKMLEEKYGKAADNYAATSQAAQQRLTTAAQGAMVAFGGALQGTGIALMNGLATIIKGLTQFWQQVWVNVAPAFGRLGEALGTLYNAFMSIFPPGSGGSTFNAAISAVSWILGAFANTLIFIVPYVIKLGQYLYIAGQYLWQFGVAVYNFYIWWYNLPGRIYSGIMNGINSFVNGARGVGQWLWNLPGQLWGLLVSKIPTLRWPTAGEILGAIRGALGISGPGYNVRSMYAEQQARRAAAFAKAGVTSSNTAAQNRQNLATAFSSYRSPFSFSGPGDGVNPTYQRYSGHRTNDVWSGDCLTGNCVDMTLGMMDRYGGSFALGTWNGGGHMWYVAPNGQQYDPSRKALEGTWSPPVSGPGSGSLIVIPVSIGGNRVEEFIVDTVTKNVYSAGRY